MIKLMRPFFKLKKIPIFRFGSLQYAFIKPVEFDDKIKAPRRDDNTLRPLSEDKGIRDYDDKFGLETVRDPSVILTHLKEVLYVFS